MKSSTSDAKQAHQPTPASDDFAGRVALVTGAAQGMGRATAARLKAGGAAVALNDLDGDQLGALAVELGKEALAVPGDVTDTGAVKRMIDATVRRFGRLDILVNNAGVLYPTRLDQISEAEWRKTIDVNLTAVFLCMQAAVPAMKANNYGRIVNLSSTAGRTVSTLGGAHYTASKAGVIGLTRSAAKELAPYGITVNAVCPGLIDTEMVRANTSPERLEAYRTSFPIQRLGTPEEVAELICFLASEGAAYITGDSVVIAGGDLMF